MLWIISGPSSVGKSTFIASRRCAEITGLSPEAFVVWPHDHSILDRDEHGNFLYHYNILRPLHQTRVRKKKSSFHGTFKKIFRGDKNFHAQHTLMFQNINASFSSDPQWNDIVKREVNKKAVVLFANKQTILQRARQRQCIESKALTNDEEIQYPSEFWLNLIQQVDFAAMYQRWLQELQHHNIPYIIVDSTDSAFPILNDNDFLKIFDDNRDSKYTKEEIEKIIKEHEFEYHRVDLPWGLHTPGADRSATRDLIFPESLVGKTVLDVGCALGYFCFEAETRGAAKVVGTELKENRFQDVMLLKDIRNSKVEFLKRDVFDDPFDEKFDYVLLLNVIHHLKEPLRSIRQLSSMVRERLIIEFPTFEDVKFKKNNHIRFPFWYNRLPLIGVSSMAKADQTYVFTPPAIKSILMDHDSLFKRIDIMRSPMPGRAIAICYKS